MADISKIVQVTVTRQTTPVAQAGFGIPLLLSFNEKPTTFTGSFKSFSSTEDYTAEVGTGTPEDLFLKRLFSQERTPERCVVSYIHELDLPTSITPASLSAGFPRSGAGSITGEDKGWSIITGNTFGAIGGSLPSDILAITNKRIVFQSSRANDKRVRVIHLGDQTYRMIDAFGGTTGSPIRENTVTINSVDYVYSEIESDKPLPANGDWEDLTLEYADGTYAAESGTVDDVDSIDNTLKVITDSNTDFYVVCPVGGSNDQKKLVADWTNSNEKLALIQDTSPNTLLNTATDDIGSELKTATNQRAAVFWTEKND